MTFIELNGFGAPDVLRAATGPLPIMGKDEVLIKVTAAGLNRADLMQRQGKYPPPQGASNILGMEVSGTVAAVTPNVRRWKTGDKVCALLSGGGYAEYVTVPASHCLPVPANIPLPQAAALPEAIITVYANLFDTAGLKAGDVVLIHGGSSGIGTAAIQMAKAAGAIVYVTAKTPEKCAFCRTLGADIAINYSAEDFVETVKSVTGKRGVDIILDMVGGDYINRNLQILAPHGFHISIATQHGAKAEIDMRLVMQKQLILTGSTLRGRDKDEKARLIEAVEAEIWPWVASGKIKPVIYQSFPLKNAAGAHKVMETGVHIGKMILEVSA